MPRPPVFFENTCVYRGFSTGGLVWRPPLDLPSPSLGINVFSFMACFRKPKEDEVVKTMNSTEMLKIIQREYPSVPSTHGTKVSIGTAMKELGFEHKEHSHVAYYKVVPLHTA